MYNIYSPRLCGEIIIFNDSEKLKMPLFRTVSFNIITRWEAITTVEREKISTEVKHFITFIED